MVEPAADVAILSALLGHLKRWLANLRRAGAPRRAESVRALQNVVRAARETAVYLRQRRDTGNTDHARERELAVLWTDLGFELDRLGVRGLAKRCDVSGRYWADPEGLDPDFLDRAGVRLDEMEKLARTLLKSVR